MPRSPSPLAPRPPHPAPLRHKVIFAPAGSGKTEQLTRRYIELLEAGVAPERILTLTFTDKAAAEMKERIFQRVEQTRPDLHRILRDNVLRLRISTIHSFCLSLVRRFAPLLDLDPRVEVMTDSGTPWETAKYDVLMRVAENERRQDDYRSLMELVARDRTQGWGRLSTLFDSLFEKRVAIERSRMLEPGPDELESLASRLRSSPVGKAKVEGYSRLFPTSHAPEPLAELFRALEAASDIFMTSAGTPRLKGTTPEEKAWNEEMCRYRQLVAARHWAAEFGRSLDLFRRRFLDDYTRSKRLAGRVDYDDMEYLAWQVLRDEAEWQNILYAFDEHTDHILVDEFQDTSFLQWGIIDKLTEEWRSGEGAKTAKGVRPTVFIVGDDKQSIYMFRDAKVEVFATAADKLERWLGRDNLERLTLENNYRSLQSIIDFNNGLFSKLMGQTGQTAPEAWRTHYAPFARARANLAPGRVEILLARSDGKVAERRELEAALIARRIRSLVASPSPRSSPTRGEDTSPSSWTGERKDEGGLVVFDKNPDPDGPEIERACQFRDIAVLIRSRTHLPVIEDALREADVPFLVIGGTGFHAEPEVRYLRSLLNFLVDPTDDVSLYVTLRGPFFEIPERDLFLATSASSIQNPESKIQNPPPLFLWDRLRESPRPALADAVAMLGRWLALVHREPLARILAQALDEREVWTRFWEPQREANVRKFLSIIEELEASGEHPLRVLRALELAGDNEPKADVRVEEQNAVQIITIHSAKGLQFPVVFLPGLDDKIRSANSAGDPLVIEEVNQDEVLVSYIPESGIRRANPFHQRYVEKEYEEEKRVFYVACTRARDAMFLTGTWGPKSVKDTRLGWLVQHLGLREDGQGFALDPPIAGVSCATPDDIPESAPAPPVARESGAPAPVARHTPSPAPRTPPPPSIRSVTRNLGKDFQMHGEDKVGLGEVIHKVLEELSNGALAADGSRLTAEVSRLLRLDGLDQSLAENVQSQIANLQSTPETWSIIKPQPDSYAELPVMYSDGTTVFTGRIDRVIVTKNEVRIYDYKTFPVRKKDLPELTREYYEGQLRFYEQACLRLFPGKKVSSFLVFTALPAVVRAALG